MTRILFDARFITPERTGVGRVTENLLDQMLKNSRGHEIHVMYHDPLPDHLLGDHSVQVQTPFDSHPRGDLHRNFNVRKLIQERSIELFFSPAFYSIQMGRGIPQVVLIHDLAVFDQPESIGPAFRLYLRNMIGSTVRNATIITTPSDFIRNRIVDRFNVSESRVRTIHLGVDPAFGSYDDKRAETLRAHYCLPSRFILNVATIEPRKNLMVLLDAYSIYKARSGDPLSLVLVGKDGFRSETIRRRAENADVATHVRFLGYIPEEDLVQLMGLAVCLVYPSTYEGFGLPVLEAMAAGCPVITSNEASLPEVTGDAAELVDPGNRTALVRAIRKVSENSSIRSRMSIAGQRRAADFTWEKTAHKYHEVFQQAMLIHREKENPE